MKEIILHIGFGKTGTTSIQHWLSKNRKLLAEQSCLYPDVHGRCKLDHHQLALHSKHEMPEAVKLLYVELVKQFQSAPHDRMILSSEQFCFCRPQYIESVAEAFRDFDVKIVFFVRDQVSLVKSTFMQMVKVGDPKGQCTIEDFFSNSKRAFDFRDRIDYWERYFGKDAISVFCYQPDLDSASKLASHLELELPSSGDTRSNPSLPYAFSGLVQCYDEADPSPGSRASFIDSLIGISSNFEQLNAQELATRLAGICARYLGAFEAGGAAENKFRRELEQLLQRLAVDGVSRDICPSLQAHIRESYHAANVDFAEKYMEGHDKKEFLKGCPASQAESLPG